MDRLNKALAKAAADPSVQDKLGKIGVSVMAKNRGELDAFLKEEGARWRKVIEENAIKVEN